LIASSPFGLENKVVLVTGASSGIGRAAAVEISKLGGTVVISGRNEVELARTLDLLSGVGHRVLACDLQDRDEVAELVDALPALDGVVNNAGISKFATLGHLNEEQFQEVLQINTLSPIFLLNRLIKTKRIRKGGSVVFTSSIAALQQATYAYSMYTTSKAGLQGFVRIAALELAGKRIRVNSVNPAMIETEMVGKSGWITPEQYEADKQRYPLKRYGRPEEVANAIAFLLSDASSWITGTSLVIDGGIGLR